MSRRTLFALPSLWLVMACTSAPEAPAPEPVEAPDAAPSHAPAPARSVPEAPHPVAEGDYSTTESGLQYYDLVVGEGESPETGSVVVVEYAGFLTDGTLFDSSYKRPDPFQFSLGMGNVIRGWDEGVADMKVGGKRQLRIPADLGYGARGAPPVIPPNATLVFDVELKEVKPPRVPPEAPQTVAESDFTVTDSGLRYHDLVEGEGKTAQAGQTVEVDYTGWLLDGTRFDSSLTRPRAFTFPLGGGRVIKGWDEGVVGMKEGGKRQLVIPPDLAYGERGRPPVIPGDSTLVFEIELLKVP